MRNLPDAALVKTPHFYCTVLSFNPWWGNLRAHMLPSRAKKIEKDLKMYKKKLVTELVKKCWKIGLPW